MLFRQLFSSYMYVDKAAKMTFLWKIRTQNVDEIDTWAAAIFGLSLKPNNHSPDTHNNQV